VPLSSRHLRQTIINGIPVFIGSGGSTYYVPSLGVQVHATGPSARQVLHTLTRSPLDVALAKGPAPTVPASWRWYTFAGLRFAAPPYLARRTGDDRFDLGCPGVVPALSPDVFLIRATSAVFPGCQLPPSEVGQIRYRNGVLVASGPDAFVQFPKRLASCRSLQGLTACVTGGAFGGVLDLTVVVPNRSRPTLIEIGLAGNGMVARTIVDSLRAA